MKNNVLDGIMGLCVADALGVPVEFMSRVKLGMNPVVGMRGFGTHNQPAGTWSDDTSMTLCLVDSLINGLDYNDIMTKFLLWFNKGLYTPHGEVFDVGISTRKALNRFADGVDPLNCGGLKADDNGNGSLMRILPILLYIQSIYGTDFDEIDEAFNIIHNVSSLTHAHKRSKIACGIYISIASMLLGSMNLKMAVDLGISKAIKYYRRKEEFNQELFHFDRLLTKGFEKMVDQDIKSSGYVVDTLEAAIWCLLNSGNYKDCVLKAVNLGEDTDTVAAVAGGLAGLYYGYENIPSVWLDLIVKREFVEGLCHQFYLASGRNSIEKLISFIPYFESASKKDVCHWGGGEKLGDHQFAMPYPEYEQSLRDFIQGVYQSNIMCYDYLDIIHERGLDGTQQMNSAIDTADLELTKAILTGFVRQERFCDGLWASAVEDKTFLRILNRLKELMAEI